MPVTSTRDIKISFTGDVAAPYSVSAASNTLSPGMIQLLPITVGNNTIAIPQNYYTGERCKAVTIVPPTGNTANYTIKGTNSGDTGFTLHSQDPSSLAIGDTTQPTLLIVAATTILGMRFIWS